MTWNVPYKWSYYDYFNEEVSTWVLHLSLDECRWAPGRELSKNIFWTCLKTTGCDILIGPLLLSIISATARFGVVFYYIIYHPDNNSCRLHQIAISTGTDTFPCLLGLYGWFYQPTHCGLVVPYSDMDLGWMVIIIKGVMWHSPQSNSKEWLTGNSFEIALRWIPHNTYDDNDHSTQIPKL